MVGQNWLPNTRFKTKAGDNQSKIKIKREQSSKSKLKLESIIYLYENKNLVFSHKKGAEAEGIEVI